MRPTLKRTMSLVISLLFLLGTVMVYSIFIRPEYDIVNELRGTLVSKSNLLAEQKAIINQVQQLLSEYKNSARVQEAVSLSLPRTEEVASVFAQLQALAQANNLFIEIFGVQSLPPKQTISSRGELAVVKDVGIVQVNLKISGGYEDLKSFLRGMETNIRVMDLISLRLEKSGRSPDVYGYGLVVNTYYQTE
jgi:Tfp pilus assembly protein PilO